VIYGNAIRGGLSVCEQTFVLGSLTCAIIQTPSVSLSKGYEKSFYVDALGVLTEGLSIIKIEIIGVV
jgi:hypothetical protein